MKIEISQQGIMNDDDRADTKDGFLYGEDDSITLLPPAGKTSFLVFKDNKYLIIPIENIAYFTIKYGSPVIVCFDKHEYFVNHSLDRIQNMVAKSKFFRINRQYLINFTAVKEIEHYYGRKLLVNLIVSVADNLLVSKEKVSHFLQWLENR